MGAVSCLQWEKDPTGLGLDEITNTTCIGRYSNYKLVEYEGTVKLEYINSDDEHDAIDACYSNPDIIAGTFTGNVSAYTLLIAKDKPWDFSDSIELFFHNNILVGVMSHRYCLWTYTGWNRKKLQAQSDFEIGQLPLLPNQKLLKRFDVQAKRSIFAPKPKKVKNSDRPNPTFTYTERLRCSESKFINEWVEEMLN